MSKITKQLLKEETQYFIIDDHHIEVRYRHNSKENFQLTGKTDFHTNSYYVEFPEEPEMRFWLTGSAHFRIIIPKVKSLLNTAKSVYDSLYPQDITMYAERKDGSGNTMHNAQNKYPEIFEKFKKMAKDDTEAVLKKLNKKYAGLHRPIAENFKQYFKENNGIDKAFGYNTLLDILQGTGKLDRAFGDRWTEIKVKGYADNVLHLTGIISIKNDEKVIVPNYPNFEFFIRGIYLNFKSQVDIKNKKVLHLETENISSLNDGRGELIGYDISDGEYYHATEQDPPEKEKKRIYVMAHLETKRALKRILGVNLYGEL